jgi:hypothetical protein
MKFRASLFRFSLTVVLIIFTVILISGCTHAAAKKSFAYNISAPLTQEPHPWLGEKVSNDPENFQFLIIADRTGGNRPGIFEQAIEKINWLQPEFVMSIGDLIEGYTDDINTIETEWQDFSNIAAKLQMPFFFVPGNHDISNDLQLLEWHKRFGSPYYHFIYKNILFLVLNTEDPAHGAISPEQTAYCLNVLHKYKNVRWTMVFMHEPIWHYGGIKGYLPVEEVLKDRPYTVFSGHYHQYLHSQKNGRDHYILATSGGVSELRGSQFGEFDQLVWVTMTAQGPQIANLAINGILSGDIVNDSTYKMVQTLLDGNWVHIEPAVNSTVELKEVNTTIHFNNPAQYPLKVKSQIPISKEIHLSPQFLELIVPAGSSKEIPFQINLTQSTSIYNLEPLCFYFYGSYLYPPDTTLALPAKSEFLLDWQHNCPRALTVGDINGKIDDWDKSLFIQCRHPQAIMEDWDWHGVQDGWFQFATVYDRDNLYLAVEFFDDRTLVYPDHPELKQDRIYIELDPAPELKNPADSAPARILKIQLSAGMKVGKPAISDSAIQAALAVKTDTSMIAELAIPWRIINKDRNISGSVFRLNIGIMDHDNPASSKPSILLWRPRWDFKQNYPGSGIFTKK